MKRTCTIFLLLILAMATQSCRNPDGSFDNYLDEVFLYFIGEDPLNISNALYYPETYDLHEKPVVALDLNYENYLSYYEGLEKIKMDLLEYDYISDKNTLTKAILIDYINRELAFSDLYFHNTYLQSYLGYQAQLPIILAEYRFDNLYDIDNYFAYLKNTKYVFSQFIKFEKDKITIGQGLSKRVIRRTIAQCAEFLNTETPFLIPVFNNKIDNLDFLSELEKEELKAINQNLVENEFLSAYRYLRNELIGLEAVASYQAQGGLATLPDGKEYYEALFQKVTGSNYTVLEAREYLEMILQEKLTKYSKDNLIYDAVYNFDSDFMGDLEINDLIPYFTLSMEDDFPKLDVVVNYQIKTIDESMQENSSPAMYLISPIDDNRDEVIYINDLYFNAPNNYTFKTIAHEGYPGHLYHNVYIKNADIPSVRKILNYVGYFEGWATYVENYVIKYGGGTKFTQEVFEFYDSINYIILGILDIGINYEGWTLAYAGEYLNHYFELTKEEVEEIYYDLIELPTNYLQYYFSYYLLKDLKKYFQDKMKDGYSDYLFHEIYLETGPAPFWILEEQYKKYAQENT